MAKLFLICLDGVRNAVDVDAGATLGLGVVDLFGLKSDDLAGNKRVVCVAICAVVASRVKDIGEVRSPGDDKV